MTLLTNNVEPSIQSQITPPGNSPNMIQVPEPGEVGYVAPALASAMQGLYNMLQTDVAAAWTLAGELAGGNLALRSIVFGFGPVGMAAFAVGYTTYQGTTWMDNQLNGALHAGVLGAAEWVIEASPGQADPYFGGDGFTTNNTPMMSGICSNWEEFLENVSQNSSANTTQLVAQIPQVIGIHII